VSERKTVRSLTGWNATSLCRVGREVRLPAEQRGAGFLAQAPASPAADLIPAALDCARRAQAGAKRRAGARSSACGGAWPFAPCILGALQPQRPGREESRASVQLRAAVAQGR
jgi:hypothetical protein